MSQNIEALSGLDRLLAYHGDERWQVIIDARAELQRLRDCELIVRVALGGGATVLRRDWNAFRIQVRTEGLPEYVEGEIVDGLPILTDEARAALEVRQ